MDTVISTVFAEFTTDEPMMVPNGVACGVYNCPAVPEVPTVCYNDVFIM